MEEPDNTTRPDDHSPASEEIGSYEEEETSAVGSAPARGIGWETYIRCFFLLAVVFLLGFLSWQPGVLRFNMLASLANPSRGERLAWKADDGQVEPLPEIRRTKPPNEWRLTSVFSADWLAQRPSATGTDNRAGRLSKVSWRRYSANPWSWQDDTSLIRHRIEDTDSQQPPQKPASSFRAGNIPAFPEQDPVLSQAVPGFPGLATNGSGLSAPPPLPPLSREENGLADSLPALPARPAGELSGFGDLQLPPLTPLDGGSGALRPPSPAPTVPPATEPAARTEPAASAPIPAPQETDWKNREITGPIPDAYLTIYPKLKFIGLCVPGQGYIRKYNQVGVPADVNNPKMTAQDGRTPYGRYYIADRNRDADGSRLYLSWPSPEDAERIGLSPQEKAAVDTAWQRQGLPPQNTRAGGGIAINGLRQWVETTEGGFTLEEPHMEEIFTALPSRAWVFIQP